MNSVARNEAMAIRARFHEKYNLKQSVEILK